MNKRIIAIGGGELKTKTTIQIDEYISNLAKEKSFPERANGLFIGTASHDFMPYFNTFRKTFTSVFNIKVDCALTVYTQMDEEKLNEKFQKANFIYVGGGDTVFMLNSWKQSGLLDKIIDAYNRGVIICGLSAGAICWFTKMYTDSEIMNGDSEEYKVYDGLNILNGLCSPHYNSRKEDFEKYLLENNIDIPVYAIENDSAIEFIDGEFSKSITSGGNSYKIEKINDKLVYTKL